MSTGNWIPLTGFVANAEILNIVIHISGEAGFFLAKIP